jgi:hypothetical protein
MAYTVQDLPAAMELAKATIRAMGHDLDQFEISILEHVPCVRVACHTDNGGFIARLFNDGHMSRLQNEITELLGESPGGLK